jgi:hypothetical protein
MSKERVESQGFYEMLWDCEFCDTKGLLAKSQRHCAECGAKQNSDKRYFPPEGQATRVDGHKYEGADRYCPNCNTPQSAKANNCTNCGAPQTEGKEVRGIAAAPPPKPKSKSKWWIWVILVVVVLGGIVFAVKWCNRTEEKVVKVLAHRWESAIAVEQYGDDQGHDWRDRMPRDARHVSCHRKQRSTRKVEDGETCKDEKVDKKDGTFEVVRKCTPKYRSEPVHDDWCRYTVTRWKQIDTIKAAGAGMEPTWPSSGLPPEQYSEVPGAKRRGKKTQTFTLDMEIPGSDPPKQSCDVSEAVWRKHGDGSTPKVEVRARSGEVVCDSL